MFISVHKPLGFWQELFGGDVVVVEGVAVDGYSIDRVEPHPRGSKIYFGSRRTLVVSETVQEILTLTAGLE